MSREYFMGSVIGCNKILKLQITMLVIFEFCYIIWVIIKTPLGKILISASSIAIYTDVQKVIMIQIRLFVA